MRRDGRKSEEKGVNPIHTHIYRTHSSHVLHIQHTHRRITSSDFGSDVSRETPCSLLFPHHSKARKDRESERERKRRTDSVCLHQEPEQQQHKTLVHRNTYTVYDIQRDRRQIFGFCVFEEGQTHSDRYTRSVSQKAHSIIIIKQVVDTLLSSIRVLMLFTRT